MLTVTPHGESLVVLDIPSVAADGSEIVTVVAKVTFTIAGGEPRRADEHRLVRTDDEVYDNSKPSSVRLPSDAAPKKVGADIVVVGAAVSARPVSSVDVGVAVRDRKTVVRVHGRRSWLRGLTGQVVVGKAAPFVEEPIVYEHAWGGASEDLSVVEQRSPVGRGVARRAAELVGRPAPQIELPGEPITTADFRGAPAGLGAIPMNWQPRVGYFGTIDEEWRRERAPLMPRDFDPRFYNTAHPMLQLPEPLRPGDPVRIEGMRAEGAIAFAVPPLRVRMTGRYDDGHEEVRESAIDTLVVLTKELEFELVCRGTFLIGRGRRVLRAIKVEELSKGT